MTAELTDNEKMNMINQHIKTCVSNRYNLQLSLIAENAVESPNQDTIDNINAQIARENARQTALEAEAATLTIVA